MQYDENLKVQYLIIQDYEWSSCRRIKYRIQNHQLPWWQRNFIFNPWRPLFYTDVSGHTHEFFNQWIYKNEIRPLNTLKEITAYINEQKRLAETAEEDIW